MQPTSPAEKPPTIHFISLLRGVASLLVMWDHLVGIWTDRYKIAFAPLGLVRDYINRPLVIIQDFGYLGVAFFFFVSGFIITHVAQRETRLVFAVKRLLRIYPPLIVSIVAIYALQRGLHAFAVGADGSAGYLNYDRNIAEMPLRHVLLSMTLLNYVIPRPGAVNGVAWTLVIEMIFYALCLLALPLLKRRPALGAGALAGVVALILYESRAFGPSFFLFAVSCSYVPLLLIGQLTYLLWSGKIGRWLFAALAIANYVVFISGVRQIYPQFYEPASSYGVSSLYAFAVFAILLLLNSSLRVPRLLNFYSKISFSLYLYHGTVGMLALGLLYPLAGYPVALVLAVGAATGASYLSWRLVEEPSQAAARRLLRRLAGSRQPEPKLDMPTVR